MPKKIIDIREVVKNARQDPRVRIDDAKALANKICGNALCDNCGGTGNEFLFMYKKCEQCNGTGKSK